MKTQRRHELQTNVLADWLGHQIEQIRPYSKLLLGAAAVIAVVAILATYLRNDQAARLSAGWSDFYSASFAQSPNDLHDVAKQHAGTEASLWALLAEADLALARGLGELYTDRESAQKSLRRAEDSYELVKNSGNNQLNLLQAAQFGLAQVYESRNKLKKAEEYYQKVAKNKTGPGREAKRRLDRLNDPEVKEFYEWFAAYKPTPPTPPEEPGMNLPDIGDLPNLGDLPERPNLPDVKVPSLTIPGAADGETNKDEKEESPEEAPAGAETTESQDPPPESEASEESEPKSESP